MIFSASLPSPTGSSLYQPRSIAFMPRKATYNMLEVEPTLEETLRSSTGPILVFNAGSSSLKFSLFRRDSTRSLTATVHGLIDGIGASPHVKIKGASEQVLYDKDLDAAKVTDAAGALAILEPWLESHLSGEKLAAIGHRVVHGGPDFSQPVRVTPQILVELRKLIPLAPLHLPANLAPIEITSKKWPGVPQVVCFDTAFHRTMPAVAQLVPLPQELLGNGVRRYGFHGISYEYIASQLPEVTKDVAPEIAEGRIIVAHLGNGASLCALHQRKSVDTTMSFTVLDGICMGTRPGGLDPGVVLYLIQERKMSAREVEDILYHRSGLLGISGVSSDMRELLKSTTPAAKLALDYFIYRIAKEMGALAAVLGGLDALVFTAGIGENSAPIRKRICEAAAWLGVSLDSQANEKASSRISAASSKVSAWIIRTNEELMIARHASKILNAR
jgi:acetate kinase